MVSTSSKIGMASICPRIIYLLNKYGNRETKETLKGEKGHEVFAKDVERSMYVQTHKGAYAAAVVIIILIILALLWLMMKGML